MGIFDIFRAKKNERSSERSGRSAVKSSKRPEKSGFIKHNAKKFIVMTKATAGNVKANVNYAIDHPQKHFAVEDRGYSKKGTYAPDSTSLKYAIARLKRDNYSVTTATGRNGYGETVTILFAKYGRPAKTTTKRASTRKVAVRKAPKKTIPATIIVSGKRYKKEATYRGNKESASGYARARTQDGYSARIKKYMINGEAVYAVYTAKKKQPKYEVVY